MRFLGNIDYGKCRQILKVVKAPFLIKIDLIMYPEN